MGTLANWFREKGVQEGLQQGLQQGMQQGISEASRKIAINLLKIKVAQNLVARATGLSIQEIHEIQKDLEKNKIGV